VATNKEPGRGKRLSRPIPFLGKSATRGETADNRNKKERGVRLSASRPIPFLGANSLPHNGKGRKLGTGW